MRARIEFEGIVQGVGFRPALHRFADGLNLAGWVMNTSAGVLLELEGERSTIEEFVRLVRYDGPVLSRVLVCRISWLPAVGFSGFSIKASQLEDGELTLLCPDIATCKDCRRELLDPQDRRSGYAFINCTNCGPRYTIVKALPYDRPQTTMAGFPLCDECRREYGDVDDRRFHAQPVACAKCGPRLWFENAEGEQSGDAITLATEILLEGGSVAIRGLGGFHIACRADDDEALLRLRHRKQRNFFKPLAVMVPDLAIARRLCRIEPADESWLTSPASPIVLLPMQPGISGTLISQYVAPRLNHMGIMLPYTPLHYLLLQRIGLPLVMTSGNLSDEPIIADNETARVALDPLVDGLLLHDRPIHARCDDSVVFTQPAGGHTVCRHSRGFSPYPIALPEDGPAVLALGGDIKTTFAVSRDNFIFLSPHLGDGEQLPTYAFFRETWEHYRRLFGLQPEAIACDQHPGYHTGGWAAELAAEYDVPLIKVQHHHGHLAALLAEYNLAGPHTAIVADGTGYGEDGTNWGGEILHGDAGGYQRLAHLLPIMLPGGDGATKEPWRIAIALLQQAAPEYIPEYCTHILTGDLTAAVRFEFPDRLHEGVNPAFAPPSTHDMNLVRDMLRSGTSVVASSALGRLFDGIAALLGITLQTTYEGQGPMELEALAYQASPVIQSEAPDGGDGGIIDWRPLVRFIIENRSSGCAELSHAFHRWVATAFFKQACRSDSVLTNGRVLATGGCLQNSLLIHMLSELCGHSGRKLITHRNIPPGDGGLAIGILRVAQARLSRGPFERSTCE